MKLGFIGCGNMAQAMIEGMLDSKLISTNEIIASDAFQPCLDGAKEKLAILYPHIFFQT